MIRSGYCREYPNCHVPRFYLRRSLEVLTISIELDDLSGEWLTSALQRAAEGAVVTSVMVLDSHSGTTGRSGTSIA